MTWDGPAAETLDASPLLTAGPSFSSRTAGGASLNSWMKASSDVTRFCKTIVYSGDAGFRLLSIFSYSQPALAFSQLTQGTVRVHLSYCR